MSLVYKVRLPVMEYYCNNLGTLIGESGEYLLTLNRERFAGNCTWRLPTVNELLSLITEPPQRHSYCLALPFDPVKKCLWSADRRSFTAAWYVSVDLGFVFWQDFNCHYVYIVSWRQFIVPER